MRWPNVGEEATLDHNDEEEEATDVVITDQLGEARLYEVRVSGTQAEGVIALQPNGKWWWLREPEQDEPWQP